MTKLEQIEVWIQKCTKCIENNGDAANLQRLIVFTFDEEIKDIGYGVNNMCYIENIQILKCKLENYKVNLEEKERSSQKEIEKLKLQNEKLRLKENSLNTNHLTVNNNNTSNSSSSATITISIEQTIEKIKEIPENILSEDEKNELEDKLSAIEVAKSTNDKEKIYNKIGNTLKYIVDKGVEVGIAVLPYLGDISKNA